MSDDERAVLRTIARRLIFHERRYRAYHPRAVDEVDADRMPDSRQDLDEAHTVAEMGRMAQQAVSEMRAEEVELMRRIDFDGEKASAIAEEQKRPEKTVRTRLKRARDRFGKILRRLALQKGGVR